ncbi:MAG TPA: redoxin domain-containing protein [Mucilaginibacter sp.]|nr:redoxin domain-containing protein [Mucilaginibacter sp.]
MLAALNISKYPYFDRSEIIPEPDFLFKPYQPVKPIKAGDVLPDFTLQKENTKWQQFFSGAEIHGPALLRQLLNKPLVLGFYSHHWQVHGLELLTQLNAIQQEIRAQDGNLLIISAEKGQEIEDIVWEHSLSLNFYFDSDKEIAEKFRIYSEHDPIWNRFSGIDTNVPVLATYVISPGGQVVYDHIDLDFAEPFPAKDIISAVARAGSLDNKVRIIRHY